MARELQKELQLSPGKAAFPRCQPRDSGRWRRCGAQVAGPQRGRGRGTRAVSRTDIPVPLPLRPRNAGCVPDRHPCPAPAPAEERGLCPGQTSLPRTRSRSGRSHARGTTPGCSSLPAMWASNHLFCRQHTINLDVGACPRVFLGRKALQGPGREPRKGVSSEHSRVTAGKDPESRGPAEVSVRLHLPSPLKLRAEPAKAGESMKSEREKLTGRDRANLSNAQTLSNQQRMKCYSYPCFSQQATPTWYYLLSTQISKSAPLSLPKSKLGR
ncbi:uncharacterized protein LOC121341577 [Onychostruthus taczanowskii]|uniref:uncharacterized protein LOC121341577 n=1 Tax=Onychostruthus taczanowskii TaxID=356909 RepID=UPI001B80196A|nr:uncharacterized protein LOC121341577 [Onychostruthus taczanowskii]